LYSTRSCDQTIVISNNPSVLIVTTTARLATVIWIRMATFVPNAEASHAGPMAGD